MRLLPARPVRTVLGLLVAPLLVVPLLALASPAAAEDEPVPPPPEPAPVRVMFVGDSITQGRQSDATYRWFVHRELERQEVAAQFVGPSTGLSKTGGAPSRYAFRDDDFSTRHAARSGSDFRYHLLRLEDRITRYTPDVVVLMLGVNDTLDRTGAEIAADTTRYLRESWALAPRLRFVLGQVPEIGRVGATVAARNAVGVEANRRIAARYGNNPKVTIARTRTDTTYPWDPDAHTYDGLHPSMAGQGLLGHLMADALHTAGVLPAPPGPPEVLPWDPRPTIRSVRVGDDGRVRLSWVGQRDAMFATAMRLSVRRPDGRFAILTGYEQEEVRTVTLPPGRYEARLTARRVRMVSLRGPAVEVVVRR